jgi:hypothetical protein
MPKDANYPCIPDISKGEILYDWFQNHVHEYKHFGTPWYIRLQRVADNPAIAFIQFRDLFSEAEIPIPPNVRVRDDSTEKDVPPYPNFPRYFQITPFSNYTVLIHVTKVALKISKKAPPYFSIITPAPDVAYKFIKKSRTREKSFAELCSGKVLTDEEEEAENAKRLALEALEPHWDTLEETFPKLPAPPQKLQHPDKKQSDIF